MNLIRTDQKELTNIEKNAKEFIVTELKDDFD
jgi:hypothetical protein